MYKLLIVEDSDAVAMGLKYALEKEGYQVQRATNVAEGREMGPMADLIILDIRLPDGDGFELCRELRKEGLIQPIVMLTAKDELIDKIIGLEVGADDYITKPFELREVIARIRSMLRRAYGSLAETGGSIIQIGDLEIDLIGQKVSVSGIAVNLTQTEFKLLTYLAQNPGQPHDRFSLLEEVWGYDFLVGDLRTVDVHIKNLRQKIEENPQSPKIIETIRGAGYKINLTS